MAKVYIDGKYVDLDLDHEAKIAESIEKGDYAGAAFYEKRRNSKIDYLGLDEEKTYRYIDENGNALYGKNDLSSLGDTSKKGGYSGSQSSRINSLMNGIMSMPRFSYDAQKDPIYQQYKAQAEESAKRATEDTMASFAGMTGGVPSSYAVTAAQQSGERYRRSADEMIPELYQLAYGMYADERADKYNQLNTLLALDQNEYSRYRDTVSDDRYADEFAYRMERDKVGDDQWRTNYDRGVFESDRSFNYGVEQDKLTQENWERQFNSQERADYFNQAYDLAASGNIPPQEWMNKAGLSHMTGQELVEGIRNGEKWLLDLQAQYTKSSGGGYASPPIENEIDENKVQAILDKQAAGETLTTSERTYLHEAGYKYDADEDMYVLVEETEQSKIDEIIEGIVASFPTKKNGDGSYTVPDGVKLQVINAVMNESTISDDQAYKVLELFGFNQSDIEEYIKREG